MAAASVSALARLKKAANLTPIKRIVTLSDGSEFVFYSSAMTIAERERAEKMPGGSEPNGFALNLLINKALDENNQKLFKAGDIAELKNEVDDADMQALMLAILKNPEEAAELDMKSSKE